MGECIKICDRIAPKRKLVPSVLLISILHSKASNSALILYFVTNNSFILSKVLFDCKSNLMS